MKTLFEGSRSFQAPHHIAFWIVAILLGLTQQVRLGIGVFAGPVVEGLLGSEDVKAYDVIGDTVNTAKRLCDSAGAGEILVSAELIESGDADEVHPEHRLIAVKGKRDPLSVCVLGGTSAS